LAIAAFERELMLERQREGIARAKSEGKYKGRKPTAQQKATQVLQLRSEKVGATEIARRLAVLGAEAFQDVPAHARRPAAAGAYRSHGRGEDRYPGRRPELHAQRDRRRLRPTLRGAPSSPHSWRLPALAGKLAITLRGAVAKL
jgi:hypothetical protein